MKRPQVRPLEPDDDDVGELPLRELTGIEPCVPCTVARRQLERLLDVRDLRVERRETLHENRLLDLLEEILPVAAAGSVRAESDDRAPIA